MSHSAILGKRIEAASVTGLSAEYISAKQRVRDAQMRYEEISAELRITQPYERYTKLLEEKNRLKRHLNRMLKEQELVHEAIIRRRTNDGRANRDPIKQVLAGLIAIIERFPSSRLTASEQDVLKNAKDRLDSW